MEISNNQSNSPSILATGTGIGIGYAINKITRNKLTHMITEPINNYCGKIINDPHSNKIVTEIADNLIRETGLEEKGLRIDNLSHPDQVTFRIKTLEELKHKRKEVLKKNKFKPIRLYKELSKINKEIDLTEKKLSFAQGKNAACTPARIIINMEKNAVAIFHEIGHALNYHFDKTWRGFQVYRRYFLKYGIAIPLIALVTPPKAKGEKPKNIVDKVGTFVRNHVGILTTLSMVPIVAEELKASQKGNKLAFDALGNTRTYKLVVKGNKIAGSTYIIGAALYGLAAWTGVKVRDMIAPAKSHKSQA